MSDVLDIPAAPARAEDGTVASGRAAEAHEQWALGVALVDQGRHDQAVAHFEHASRLAPGEPLYWLNLANVLRRQLRPREAIAAARRAVALDPAGAVSCLLLARLLHGGNRNAEALEVLDALDPGTPRDLDHKLLRATVLMALQRWQETAQASLEVLGASPAHTHAYLCLGFALKRMGRYAEAAECFRTVTILEPAHFGASVYAAHYAAWACDWTQCRDDMQRMVHALALQAAGTLRTALSPFTLLSLSDDAAMQRRCAEMEGERLALEHRRGSTRTLPREHARARAALAAGRIRIGFVSPDFRLHATTLLLVQTLERLPRDRFEVFLYSHGADDGSGQRRRIAAAADHFVECGEMDATEQAERIEDDGIVLLVDLSGHTSQTRLGMFALRPAPLQVPWLGYPGTTGCDFMDYLVGDPTVTPLEHAADFTEQIAQLPQTYQPTDELREHPEPSSRAEAGLPEDAFVFACFNQHYKITEEVFSRWCRILQRVPGSLLWLLVPQPEIQAALRARAEERGVAASRLIFAPFVTQTAHLARLPLADLFLDTFPCGAHTTCNDALWMGLPVLTQVGRSFPARVAASLVGAVGLPHMAMADPAAYEERAVELALVPGELRAMREHLRANRLELPLFDNRRFSAEVAALFERMVARWEQGLAPAALPAAP